MPEMITGVVTDPSGVPVAGAVVLVAASPVPVPDIAALTGADGRFAIDVPRAGDYRIQVRGGAAVCEQDVVVGRPAAEVVVKLPTRGDLVGCADDPPG